MRSRGTKEYLPPVRGLNTSLSPRAESPDFFSDGQNIRVRTNPLRLEPRKGLFVDRLLSSTDSYLAVTPQTDVDVSYGEWKTPNNDKEKSFVWVKSGTILYFVDVETLNVLEETVDLEDALSGTVLGTAQNLANSPVEGRLLKGNLILVGEAINPVVLTWDGTNIQGYVLNLLVRDMLGIEDGLDVDDRPATLSEKHEYNLFNQGWYKQRRIVADGVLSDPIAKFQTDTGTYPSNADISHLAIVDDGAGELLFDSDFLQDLTFGNTPAPRGHYVLDAFDMNRETKRNNPEVSELGTGGSGGASDLDGNPDLPPSTGEPSVPNPYDPEFETKIP